MSEVRLVGQVIGGKFRVLRRLGQGGMGVVYEAQNELTGKRVALKCLHAHLVENADAGERFMREARVASRIHHRNVVDLYDVLQHDGALFLVMEYLRGESLADYLDHSLRLVPEIVQLLVDAMRGLAAAHELGIVHRDLKPENIFLARESGDDERPYTPKLLDFGISKLLQPETGQLKLTKTGSTFGTPRYMSYEQLLGFGDVDVRADVYSFGVILYEAVTGHTPYPALNFQQLLVQFGSIRPERPRKHRPELPGELEEVILATLSLDRNKRPQTIDALIAAIKPFAATQSAPARNAAPMAPLARHAAPTEPPPPHAAPTEPPPRHAAPTEALPAPQKLPPRRALDELPLMHAVAPRREHLAQFSGRDLPRLRKRGRLRSSHALAACALVAVAVWLLKPSDEERAEGVSASSQVAAVASMALPVAAKLEVEPVQPAPAALSPAAEPAWPGADNPGAAPPGSSARIVPQLKARPGSRRAVDAGVFVTPLGVPVVTKPRARERVPVPRTDQF